MCLNFSVDIIKEMISEETGLSSSEVDKLIKEKKDELFEMIPKGYGALFSNFTSHI